MVVKCWLIAENGMVLWFFERDVLKGFLSAFIVGVSWLASFQVIHAEVVGSWKERLLLVPLPSEASFRFPKSYCEIELVLQATATKFQYVLYASGCLSPEIFPVFVVDGPYAVEGGRIYEEGVSQGWVGDGEFQTHGVL